MFISDDRIFRRLMAPRENPPPIAGATIEHMSRGGCRWIDRRRVPRQSYRTQAWLEPVDETGALRSPIIYTRDLDQFGAGFIAQHDVSALAVVVLHLPALDGRPAEVRCFVRRCRELTNRWYEGLLEFTKPQLQLGVKQM